MSQSAFIVRVPAAEPYVAHWRERFDASARLGVPAHITLLFPFMPAEQVTERVLEQVRGFAASLEPFAFCLGAIGHFPQVLFLAPEPATPFVALTAGLVSLFPEFPPYAGQYESVVPHLTVAHAGEAELLEVEAGLTGSLGSHRIQATCAEFALIENSSGLWRPLHTFPLGAATHADG